MILYSLISVSGDFSEAVGYKNGRSVNWEKTQFATNSSIIQQLESEGKALNVPQDAAPMFIEDLGNMLQKDGIQFNVYQIRVSDDEVIALNSQYKSQYKEKSYA